MGKNMRSRCPQRGHARRPGLSLRHVEGIWTGDAERDSGLLVPAAEVARVHTAERLDTPQDVGKAAIHVESSHTASLFCEENYNNYNPAHNPTQTNCIRDIMLRPAFRN